MQTSPIFERDESPASERLAALTAKTNELLATRRELAHGLPDQDDDGTVIALMSGLDLDNTLRGRYANLEEIDKNINALTGAVRRVADELAHEKVAAGREAREGEKSKLEKALKSYLAAARRVKAAADAIGEINAGLQAEGHAGFDGIPFPGMNVRNFEARERIFLDTVKMKLGVEL
jgi:hypothetical protein